MAKARDPNTTQHSYDFAHYGELPAAAFPSGSQVAMLGFAADGGASVLTTGVKAEIPIFFSGSIMGVELLADMSGSCTIGVEKGTYGGFPATASIVGASPPTLSSQIKYLDFTLTGWTIAIRDGDVIRFKINTISSIKRLSCTLRVERT